MISTRKEETEYIDVFLIAHVRITLSLSLAKECLLYLRCSIASPPPWSSS